MNSRPENPEMEGCGGLNASGAGAKPRVSPAEYSWLLAFEKIAQDQVVILDGEEYKVAWKYQEGPYWLQLKGNNGKRMVRMGDPAIYELRAFA